MVGDVVENFKLKDQNGNEFDLYKNLTNKILLVFYPKDNTPVCSMQMTDYNLNHEEYNKYKIQLIGINTGSVLEHNTFCSNHGFKFPILSDNNKNVSEQFKALNIFGHNKRKLVLIGTDKRILFEKTVFSIFYLDSIRIIKSLKELKII